MLSLRTLINQPQLAWRRFIFGAIIFAFGLIPMLLINTANPLFHWLFVAIMFIGFTIAMTGYLAIFVSRFNHVKNRNRFKS